ncbi:DeoR/GlpR family DNA-binding transcription regulator [Pontivivens insulae]|uniref:Glycerol-3-phosphate regulon repressor n=1 Tax=Pontivivens insulae TaxID=1639689 RepID=A0A2R8A9X4_9RHOB|nr:DeoR/GlpR family DNA-binding transcription regulator [Pontivivens insulae]RED12789.1 DeoR family transcriptional regulator [Pontivivens insulae]SPF28880.1 Glycerol-3-phosphate regulon repressor [Pontivivens insulae]
MTLTQRQRDLLSLLNSQGRVLVADMVQRFETTPQTIRKDLRQLEQMGRAVRFHGGAVRAPGQDYIRYEHRKLVAARQKARIGATIAQLIPDNATVFINVGTTTEEAAMALGQHSGLRVICDNVNVANNLRAMAGVQVLIAGGGVRDSDGAIVGEQAVSFIRQFRVDYALIGAAAIAPNGDLLDHDLREAQVAAAIMETARHVILGVDQTKFGQSAPVFVGRVSQVHTLVSDGTPPDAIRAICEDSDVAIKLA